MGGICVAGVAEEARVPLFEKKNCNAPPALYARGAGRGLGAEAGKGGVGVYVCVCGGGVGATRSAAAGGWARGGVEQKLVANGRAEMGCGGDSRNGRMYGASDGVTKRR